VSKSIERWLENLSRQFSEKITSVNLKPFKSYLKIMETIICGWQTFINN